jgi:hypothetical protein
MVIPIGNHGMTPGERPDTGSGRVTTSVILPIEADQGIEQTTGWPRNSESMALSPVGTKRSP